MALERGKVATVLLFALFGLMIGGPFEAFGATGTEERFTSFFPVDKADLATTGRNRFFILEPGYSLRLEGREDGQNARDTITVLDETKTIDGVVTRVVEERHLMGGELVEVSRNFFAFDRETTNVFYFGEAVDNYENGRVINHNGSWRAGSNGARFGLIMPGTQLLGARYFQEIAPKRAMDRAKTIRVRLTVTTPVGKFKNSLKTEETTPREPGVTEFKIYAPGIGLVQDGGLKLVRRGFF